MADETQTTETTTTEKTPTKQTPAQDPGVFTAEQQERINAIVGSRAKEASAAALSALAKELGYDSVDDMKVAAKEAKQRKEDEKSEIDKAKERADKAEAKAAAKEAELAELAAARLADKVDNKILALAKDAKAKNPEDVLDRLRGKRAEDLAKLADDKGAIDDKGIEKLIADVKKDRPEWFAVSGPGSPSNKDGRPPQPDTSKIFDSMPKVRL